MKRIILSVLVLGTLLTSCKKDDPAPQVCTLSATSLVGTYKITSAVYKADASTAGVEVINNPLFFETCSADDLIGFNANNSVTYTDAGTACVPSSGGTGTWSLSGSVLTLDGDAATVTSFSCTNMIVSVSNFQMSGDNMTITLTRQ